MTLRGRSAFDTHAREECIAPGVRAGSGTMQKPLDLSMSILRQCWAVAMPTSRIHAIPSFRASDKQGYLLSIFLAKALAIVAGWVAKMEICPNRLCGSWNTPSCLNTVPRS